MCQWALAQKRTHGGALERCHGAPFERLAQRGDALGGVGATTQVVKAAELVARQTAHSGECQWALTRLLSHGSLAHNQLCSIDRNGNGTYTAEGITKLCEALKGSAVTSLKCAATQKCLLSCQCPQTHLRTHFLPSLHVPTRVNKRA